MDAAWTKVDPINMPTKLAQGLPCYYLYVYTPDAGYNSKANQLVLNYKISPEALRKNPSRQRYKDEAVEAYASALEGLLESLLFKANNKPITTLGRGLALLPAPPSTPIDDFANYDSRNVLACQMVVNHLGLTLARDIEMASDIGPSHLKGTRDANVLANAMVRSGYAANHASIVFIVDDLLVSGAHITAIQSVLRRTGCNAVIAGAFLARSIRDDASITR